MSRSLSCFLALTFVSQACGDSKSSKKTDPIQEAAIDELTLSTDELNLAPDDKAGLITVKWRSRNTVSCKLILGDGQSYPDRLPNDEIVGIPVTQSTSVALTCKDTQGDEIRSEKNIKLTRVDIKVPHNSPEPKILDLAVTPNPLFIFSDDAPQPIKIVWKTEGLSSCELTVKSGAETLENLGGIGASGTEESFRIRTSSDVTLTCKAPNGQDMSKTVQALVTIVERPEKCETSEQTVYLIRTLDDNALRFFSSKEDRDREFTEMQKLPICKDGNCAKEDKTNLIIQLNGKDAFLYELSERTIRNQHMASLQSSGFCSQPTRVSAQDSYITIDGKSVFYVPDNEKRLNWLLEMFQNKLPSSTRCGVTSSYVTLDGRDVFYESDDNRRWNAFVNLEKSGFCSAASRVSANRSHITLDGRDAFYESDPAKRLQWMLDLVKKNILPEDSRCSANRSYISISGRDVFYEGDDRKRADILERLVGSGYCTSASSISANRSYITVDGRDVFYEGDDAARLNWMLSLFQSNIFPAGSRCNVNRSYITIDGRNVFYESDDRTRARTLSILFASGYCTAASELSANRSYLTLGSRDVFYFSDDDVRLARLIESFKAGLGKAESRCSATRNFVTIDRKDAFHASQEEDRLQMLVKLEKSGFCSRPSKFAATTSAVTIDGKPVHVIADHEARLEKLITLFQGEFE